MPYIREAIESLKRQDCDDFEVIVQKAASTDRTTQYLEAVEGLNIHIDHDPTDQGKADLGLCFRRGDLWRPFGSVQSPTTFPKAILFNNRSYPIPQPRSRSLCLGIRQSG